MIVSIVLVLVLFIVVAGLISNSDIVDEYWDEKDKDE